MPNFIIKITNENDDILINDENIECRIISTNLSRMAVQKIINRLQTANKIILLDGEKAVDYCVDMGVDGIVADLSCSNTIKKDISILREKLGEGVLGVVCRNRRHEAMLISENEPDFIVFKVWDEGKEKTAELSKWYSELFLIQQAVELSDDKTDYRDFSADMVILSPEQYKILVAQRQRLG